MASGSSAGGSTAGEGSSEAVTLGGSLYETEAEVVEAYFHLNCLECDQGFAPVESSASV